MRTQNPIINTGTPWKPLSGWNIIFVTLWLERWANIQVHHLMMLLYKYSCWVQWNCTKNEQNYIRKPDLCAVIEIRIHRNNELNWKTNFYPQNWYQNKNYDPSGFFEPKFRNKSETEIFALIASWQYAHLCAVKEYYHSLFFLHAIITKWEQR